MNNESIIEQQEDKLVNLPDLKPISESKRIDIMDILRGFALIGIILMNIEWFSRPISELGRFDFDLTGIDWAAGWLVKVFVEGKFYKLFSLLFGMGFAVMLLRAQEVGRPFGAWFTRRMIVLFLIGMAHLVFLWSGDILHDYAVGGLLLLGWVMLIRTKRMQRFNNTKSFLRIGLFMLAFPIVLSLIGGLILGPIRSLDKIEGDWQQREAIVAKIAEIEKDPVMSEALILEAKEAEGKTPEKIHEENMTEEEIIQYKSEQRFVLKNKRDENTKKSIEALTQDSYWVATVYHAKESLSKLKATPVMALFMGFPLFMIGYWFIASGVMQKPKKHLVLFKNMAWIGTGVGLFLSVAGVLISTHPATKNAIEIRASGDVSFFLGQLFLTAGYLGLIVLLCLTVRGKKILSKLAPMGRMALTNYIMHSVILCFIFFGYGLGMYGDILRGQQVLIAVAILIAQGFISSWWLNHFKFGPLEWLWRSLTYLKAQPMKKPKEKNIELTANVL